MDCAPNKNRLPSLLKEVDTLCDMKYMYELTALNNPLLESLTSNIGFIEIHSFPTSDIWESFSYIINSLCTLNSTLGYIFTAEKGEPIIYIGISSSSYLNESINTVYEGLINMFPGITPYILTPMENNYLLNKVFSTNNNSISSISCIPKISDIPILNTFSKLMGCNSEFYLFLLATPCPYKDISARLNKLRFLVSELSQFSIENRACSSSVSKSSSATSSNSLTCTTGHSLSDNNTCGSALNFAEYTNLTPTTSIPLLENRNMNISLLANKGKGTSNNASHTDIKVCSDSDSKTNSSNDQSSTNRSEGSKLNFVFQNKVVASAIDRIDALITRYQSLTSYSSMYFSAYALSPNISTTTRSGNIYLGCAHTSSTTLPTHINMWTDESPGFDYILGSLRDFKYPSFTLNNGFGPINSSHIISTSELMSTLYFI